MSLSVLSKLGIKNIEIKTSLAEQLAAGTQRKEDPRILNYFDMDFGGKMKVLFLPSKNGEFFRRVHTHGKRTDLQNVRLEHYQCPRQMLQEECSICNNMFDLYREAKNYEKSNPKMYTELRQLAGRMQTTEMFMIQCIVLESPVEMRQTDDGNEVRVLFAPRAIREEIEKNLNSGEINEETFSLYPFIIHKQKRDNSTYAEYSSSLFSRNQVTDQELSYFQPVYDAAGNVVEESKVEPYDFDELHDMVADMLPNMETGEEWCKSLVEAVNSGDVKNDDDGNGGKSVQNDRIPASARTGEPVRQRPRVNLTNRAAPAQAYDNGMTDADEQINEGYIHQVDNSVNEKQINEVVNENTPHYKDNDSVDDVPPKPAGSLDAIRNRMRNRMDNNE